MMLQWLQLLQPALHFPDLSEILEFLFRHDHHSPTRFGIPHGSRMHIINAYSQYYGTT